MCDGPEEQVALHTHEHIHMKVLGDFSSHAHRAVEECPLLWVLSVRLDLNRKASGPAPGFKSKSKDKCFGTSSLS